MGLIYADIKLSNPAKEGLQSMDVKSLVDTGALFLCIPEHISIQLQLKEFEKREVTVADGSKKICSYVGPVKINFNNRTCLTGALVLGEMVLLGAIPIEDMDLVIHPAKLKLMANPENPNIPGALAMGVKY
jgi:clan AA aspartic protease